MLGARSQVAVLSQVVRVGFHWPQLYLKLCRCTGKYNIKKRTLKCEEISQTRTPGPLLGKTLQICDFTWHLQVCKCTVKSNIEGLYSKVLREHSREGHCGLVSIHYFAGFCSRVGTLEGVITRPVCGCSVTDSIPDSVPEPLHMNWFMNC